MLKQELTQITTVGDLEIFYQRIHKDIEKFASGQILKKDFYTPKEFAHLTGEKYSTIIYKCKMGRLKARQDGAGCNWQIFSSEIDRYKNEANEIFNGNLNQNINSKNKSK